MDAKSEKQLVLCPLGRFHLDMIDFETSGNFVLTGTQLFLDLETWFSNTIEDPFGEEPIQLCYKPTESITGSILEDSDVNMVPPPPPIADDLVFLTVYDSMSKK